MPFKKFVEIGRVAVLNGDGPNKGKIAAIVNVIDQNRVLVDGPTSGVLRQVSFNSLGFWQYCICFKSPSTDIESVQAYPIKQLQLTPISVKFPFNASTKTVRAELVANKVDETWF